jgi:hypothetical protein
VADPMNRIFESDETDNASRTVVQLPFKGHAGTCRNR